MVHPPLRSHRQPQRPPLNLFSNNKKIVEQIFQYFLENGPVGDRVLRVSRKREIVLAIRKEFMAKIIIGTIYRKEKFILHCEEKFKRSLCVEGRFPFYFCFQMQKNFLVTSPQPNPTAWQH